MNRFTKRKPDSRYVYINEPFHFVGKYVDKLGQIEDIEEETNFDIIILFKVFKYGFWFKEEEALMNDNDKERFKQKHYIDYDSEHKFMFQPGLNRIKNNYIVPIAQLSATILNDKIEYFLSTYYSAVLLLKDYGKTWALTREELV